MSKTVLASLFLVALVPMVTQACGGASEVAIGGDDPKPDTSATAAPSDPSVPSASPEEGGTPGSPDASAPQDGASDAPACPTYYRDEDADGFGGATKQVSCTPPGAGWVEKGGDCNDANKDVFPGQLLFFGVPIASAPAISFDYDCSTKEEARPALPKAGPCMVGVGGCTGEGYLPAEPLRTASASVDPYCGSARYRICRLVNGQCVTTDSKTDKAYDCR